MEPTTLLSAVRYFAAASGPAADHDLRGRRQTHSREILRGESRQTWLWQRPSLADRPGVCPLRRIVVGCGSAGGELLARRTRASRL